MGKTINWGYKKFLYKWQYLIMHNLWTRDFLLVFQHIYIILLEEYQDSRKLYCWILQKILIVKLAIVAACSVAHAKAFAISQKGTQVWQPINNSFIPKLSLTAIAKPTFLFLKAASTLTLKFNPPSWTPKSPCFIYWHIRISVRKDESDNSCG